MMVKRDSSYLSRHENESIIIVVQLVFFFLTEPEYPERGGFLRGKKTDPSACTCRMISVNRLKTGSGEINPKIKPPK